VVFHANKKIGIFLNYFIKNEKRFDYLFHELNFIVFFKTNKIYYELEAGGCKN